MSFRYSFWRSNKDRTPTTFDEVEFLRRYHGIPLYLAAGTPATEPHPMARRMSSYTGPKQIWAMKIKGIDVTPEIVKELNKGHKDVCTVNQIPYWPLGAVLHFEEPGSPPYPVSEYHIQTYEPKVGGYFIIYVERGRWYESWSSAAGFERDYTLDQISHNTPRLA